MPRINVVFFQDDDGNVPALEWLREVKRRDKRITAKFHERIIELKELWLGNDAPPFGHVA